MINWPRVIMLDGMVCLHYKPLLSLNATRDLLHTQTLPLCSQALWNLEIKLLTEMSLFSHWKVILKPYISCCIAIWEWQGPGLQPTSYRLYSLSKQVLLNWLWLAQGWGCSRLQQHWAQSLLMMLPLQDVLLLRNRINCAFSCQE